MIITFRQVETAGLVKVSLGVRKFCGVAAWLIHRAVTAGGPGSEHGQQGRLRVRSEDQTAEGSEIISQRSRHEGSRSQVVVGQTGLVAEQPGLAPQRIRVRAENVGNITQAGVRDGAVKIQVADVAGRVGAFCQDDRLLGLHSVTRNSLGHHLLGLRQRVGGEHRREKRIAGSAGGSGLRKGNLAGGVAVRDAHVSAAVGSQTVKQCRGGCVDGTVGGQRLERDVHGEDDIVNLVRQLPGGEHGQQRLQKGGLKIVAGPHRVGARPGNPQHIVRGHAPLFAEKVGQLAGVRTVLAGNDHNIESASARARVSHRQQAGRQNSEVQKFSGMQLLRSPRQQRQTKASPAAMPAGCNCFVHGHGNCLLKK